MLGKFMNLFFEEEEIIDDVNEEEGTPITKTVVAEEKLEEVRKMPNITIDAAQSTAFPEPVAKLEKVQINPSVFIQSEARPVNIPSIGSKAVEYEFNPVLSPIFGVVSGERKSIKIFPNVNKTEVLQPKESVLGVGIRPYAGIVENRNDNVDIPFNLKNGSLRESSEKIEKIELEEIIQSPSRMHRYNTETQAPHEEPMIIEERTPSIDEIGIPDFPYERPEIEVDPINEQVANQQSEPFDESAIIVKEKPAFFQTDEDINIDSMQQFETIEDEENLSFEEEDMNLFNMEL